MRRWVDGRDATAPSIAASSGRVGAADQSTRVVFTSKPNFFEIPRHIESYATCMKY
jgi:hypothetical protein